MNRKKKNLACRKQTLPLENLPLEKQLYLWGLAAPFLTLIAVWLHQRLLAPLFPFQGCIWDKMLGIYCPGCGGTRAVLALLHGKPLLSLWYHPFVLYAAVLYACFMLSHTAAGLWELCSRIRQKSAAVPIQVLMHRRTAGNERSKIQKADALPFQGTQHRLYGMKFHPWYLYVGIALIIINFIFKNVLRLGFHISM